MPIIEIIFYLFGGVLTLSALSVITSRNPVYSVLFLVLCFFSAACIWLLLEAEFLAITLVLVYVGAVMVLFLFVVMMLDINLTKLKAGFARYLPVGILVALAMAAQLFILVWSRGLDSQVLVHAADEGSNTRLLGEVLFTEYLYPFEIAGFILLVAIVAAIMLTHRRRPQTKYQDPSQQVRIRREDRVRLVRVESEGEDS
ncbi:NADH-quinone oxidoreductase subunit J [Wenzhouxiangella sp. XN79A]|uniref:NADH-quinone oxidoreductase subunit J n=1 Tax=Wenzhouxiangella sp. XN79A TaxID=2724193 RepID=UPI00144AB5A7|nr:NADH-quinone oxidoreductase subunit J [Wenzhouxiangella sp. XN79A]NKI35729.1 NADH-quinone oxidoreductase subunit J [Wenzhouxiangella sp. XN79A]